MKAAKNNQKSNSRTLICHMIMTSPRIAQNPPSAIIILCFFKFLISLYSEKR
jgi:hypothetical protein